MITKNRPFRRIVAILMTIAMCLGLAVTVPMTLPPVKAAGPFDGFLGNASLEAALNAKVADGLDLGTTYIDLDGNTDVFGDVDISKLLAQFPNLQFLILDNTNVTDVINNPPDPYTVHVMDYNTFKDGSKSFVWSGHAFNFNESAGTDLSVEDLLMDQIMIRSSVPGVDDTPIPARMISSGTIGIRRNDTGNPTDTSGLFVDLYGIMNSQAEPATGSIDKDDVFAYPNGVRAVKFDFYTTDSATLQLHSFGQINIGKNGYTLEPADGKTITVYDGGLPIYFIFKAYKDGNIPLPVDINEYDVYLIGTVSNDMTAVPEQNISSDGTLSLKIKITAPLLGTNASSYLRIFPKGAGPTNNDPWLNVSPDPNGQKVILGDADLLQGNLMLVEYNPDKNNPHPYYGPQIGNDDKERAYILGGTSISSLDENKVKPGPDIYTDTTIYLLWDDDIGDYVPSRYLSLVDYVIGSSGGTKYDLTCEIIEVPDVFNTTGDSIGENALGIIITANSLIGVGYTYDGSTESTKPVKIFLKDDKGDPYVSVYLNAQIIANPPKGYMIYQVPESYANISKSVLETEIRDENPDITLVAHYSINSSNQYIAQSVPGATIVEDSTIYLVVTAYYEQGGSTFIVPASTIAGWYYSTTFPPNMFNGGMFLGTSTAFYPESVKTSIYGNIDVTGATYPGLPPPPAYPPTTSGPAVFSSDTLVLRLTTDTYKAPEEIGELIFAPVSSSNNLKIPVTKVEKEIKRYILARSTYTPVIPGSNALKDLNEAINIFNSTTGFTATTDYRYVDLYNLNILGKDEIEIGGINSYIIFAVYTNDKVEQDFLATGSVVGGITVTSSENPVPVSREYILSHNSWFNAIATANGGPEDYLAGKKAVLTYDDGNINTPNVVLELTITPSKITGLYVVYKDYFGRYFSSDAALYENYDDIDDIDDIDPLTIHFQLPIGTAAEVYAVYAFANEDFYKGGPGGNGGWMNYIAKPNDVNFMSGSSWYTDNGGATGTDDYFTITGVNISSGNYMQLRLTSTVVPPIDGKDHPIASVTIESGPRYIDVVGALITNVAAYIDGDSLLTPIGTTLSPTPPYKVGDIIQTAPHVWLSDSTDGRLSSLSGYLGKVEIVADLNYVNINNFDLTLIKATTTSKVKVTYIYTVTINGLEITVTLPDNPLAILSPTNDYWFDFETEKPAVEKIYLVAKDNAKLTWNESEEVYTLPYDIFNNKFNVYPVAMDSSVNLQDPNDPDYFDYTNIDYITPDDVSKYSFLNYMYEDDFDITWDTISVTPDVTLPAANTVLFEFKTDSSRYLYIEFLVYAEIKFNDPVYVKLDAAIHGKIVFEPNGIGTGTGTYSGFNANNMADVTIFNMPDPSTLKVVDITPRDIKNPSGAIATAYKYKINEDAVFDILYTVSENVSSTSTPDYNVLATVFDIPGTVTVLPGSPNYPPLFANINPVDQYDFDDPSTWYINVLRINEHATVPGPYTFKYDSGQLVFNASKVGIYEFELYTINISGLYAPDFDPSYRILRFEVEPIQDDQTIYYGKTYPIDVLSRSGFPNYDSIVEDNGSVNKVLDPVALAAGVLKMKANADSTTTVKIYNGTDLIAEIDVTCVGMTIVNAKLSQTTDPSPSGTKKLVNGEETPLYWIVTCHPNDAGGPSPTSDYELYEYIDPSMWDKMLLNTQSSGTLAVNDDIVTANASDTGRLFYTAGYTNTNSDGTTYTRSQIFYAEIIDGSLKVYSYVLSEYGTLDANGDVIDPIYPNDTIEMEIGDQLILYVWDINNLTGGPVAVLSGTNTSNNIIVNGKIEKVGSNDTVSLDALSPGTAEIAVYPKPDEYFKVDVIVNAKQPPARYIVTFDENGGEWEAGVTPPVTRTVTSPSTTVGTGNMPIPPPTLSGYTFIGWNTVQQNGTSSTAFDGTTPVTAPITVYAQYGAQPVPYEVTFDENGGEWEAGVTLPVTRTVTSPSTTVGTGNMPTPPPTLSGYRFDGWYTQSNSGSTEFTGTTIVTADITVYAKWVQVYTVTFDANGGEWEAGVTPPVTKIVDANTAIGTANMPTPSPTLSGHTFAGWNTRLDGSGDLFTADTIVTESIRVYAQWKDNGGTEPTTYTVEFDDNYAGGTGVIATVTVNANATVTNMPTATRAGYTFMAWNTAADGSGDAFDGTTPVTGNITVYAQWERAVTYKVTFKANYGSNATLAWRAVTLPATTVGANMPVNPTRSEYTFLGWNKAADGSGDAFDGTTLVTGNITVYAQWEYSGVTQPTTYKVTFEANYGNEGTIDTVSVIAPATTVGANMPDDPTRAGYTFKGWNTRANGSGTAFDKDTPVTEDITVYAQWEKVVTYKVTFKANYGMNATLGTCTVRAGDVVGAANMPADPVRSGNTFVGWNRAANGSGTAFTANTVVTGDITVYAQWIADSTSESNVTICFNANGGSGNKQPVTIAKGNTYKLPENPYTRNGYSFAGWKINNTGSTLAIGTTITVNENITLYAQWEIAPNNSLVGGVYIPIIIGGTNYGSSISETEVVFDKNSSGDITVMVVSGNSSWVGDYKLQCLKNKNRMLVNGVDYTVNGDIVTIKASYLKTLSVGEQTITFVMNGGVDPKLNINIVDRAP